MLPAVFKFLFLSVCLICLVGCDAATPSPAPIVVTPDPNLRLTQSAATRESQVTQFAQLDASRATTVAQTATAEAAAAQTCAVRNAQVRALLTFVRGDSLLVRDLRGGETVMMDLPEGKTDLVVRWSDNFERAAILVDSSVYLWQPGQEVLEAAIDYQDVFFVGQDLYFLAYSEGDPEITLNHYVWGETVQKIISAIPAPKKIGPVFTRVYPSPDGKYLVLFVAARPQLTLSEGKFYLVDLAVGNFTLVAESLSAEVAWASDSSAFASFGFIYNLDTGKLVSWPPSPTGMSLFWKPDNTLVTILSQQGVDLAYRRSGEVRTISSNRPLMDAAWLNGSVLTVIPSKGGDSYSRVVDTVMQPVRVNISERVGSYAITDDAKFILITGYVDGANPPASQLYLLNQDSSELVTIGEGLGVLFNNHLPLSELILLADQDRNIVVLDTCTLTATPLGINLAGNRVQIHWP